MVALEEAEQIWPMQTQLMPLPGEASRAESPPPGAQLVPPPNENARLGSNSQSVDLLRLAKELGEPERSELSTESYLMRHPTAMAAEGSSRLRPHRRESATRSALLSNAWPSASGAPTASWATTASALSDVGKLSLRSSDDTVVALEGELHQFYEITGKPVGVGSFGTIYRARDKKTLAIRAVKTMALQNFVDFTVFEKELHIFKQLEHDNITKLFAHFQCEHHVYLVMEFCSGGDLLQKLSCGRSGVKPDLIPHYVWQMFAGVAYCHHNRIAHRDIKLENFMFQDTTRRSPLKLIDFGLSSTFEPGIPMTEAVGTPGYCAPEILRSPVRYDEKCDIWSLGVVIYALYSQAMPFKGKTVSEIGRLTCFSEVKYAAKSWRWKPKEKDFVESLLQSTAKDRPAARDVLKIEWLRRIAKKGNTADAPCCTVH